MNTISEPESPEKIHISLIIDDDNMTYLDIGLNEDINELCNRLCDRYDLETKLVTKLKANIEKHVSDVKIKQGYNEKTKSDQRIDSLVKRLYNDSVKTQIEKRKLEERIKQANEEKKYEGMTFSPKISHNSNYIYNRNYMKIEDKLYYDSINNKEKTQMKRLVDKIAEREKHLTFDNKTKKTHKKAQSTKFDAPVILLNNKEVTFNAKKESLSKEQISLSKKDISSEKKETETGCFKIDIMKSEPNTHNTADFIRNSNKKHSTVTRFKQFDVLKLEPVNENIDEEYSKLSSQKSPNPKKLRTSLSIHENYKLNMDIITLKKHSTPKTKESIPGENSHHSIDGRGNPNKTYLGKYLSSKAAVAVKDNKENNLSTNSPRQNNLNHSNPADSSRVSISKDQRRKVKVPIHEKLYKLDKIKTQKIKDHQSTILKKICPFKPKINKNSSQMVNAASLKETKIEFFDRLTNTKKVQKLTHTKNSYSTDFRSSTLRLVSPISKRSSMNNFYNLNTERIGYDKPKIREIKEEQKLISNLENINMLNEVIKEGTGRQLSMNIELYRQNKLKEYFDIIVGNVSEMSELNNLENYGIPIGIKEKVIIPTCHIMNDKNIELNFENFYVIANEIMNYIL
jgi:hypothetical protein